jgi:hypothetical protein
MSSRNTPGPAVRYGESDVRPRAAMRSTTPPRPTNQGAGRCECAPALQQSLGIASYRIASRHTASRVNRLEGETSTASGRRIRPRFALACHGVDHHHRLRRPALEVVERGVVLSIVTVDLATDAAPTTGGQRLGPLTGNLRWCIDQASARPWPSAAATLPTCTVSPGAPTERGWSRARATSPCGSGTACRPGNEPAQAKAPRHPAGRGSRDFRKNERTCARSGGACA